MFADLRKKLMFWMLVFVVICFWICSGLLPGELLVWPAVVLLWMLRRQLAETLPARKPAEK